jgi:hypothetical protein
MWPGLGAPSILKLRPYPASSNSTRRTHHRTRPTTARCDPRVIDHGAASVNEVRALEGLGAPDGDQRAESTWPRCTLARKARLCY